jgi:hypothetical protein
MIWNMFIHMLTITKKTKHARKKYRNNEKILSYWNNMRLTRDNQRPINDPFLLCSKNS